MKLPKSGTRFALVGGAVLLVVAVVGLTHTASPEPKVITKTVVKYKTVTKAKTITKTTNHLPKSCRDTIAAADQVWRHSEAMYNFSDEQLHILSAARATLIQSNDLSTIENRQRKLQGRTIGSLGAMETALYKYEIDSKKCARDSH